MKSKAGWREVGGKRVYFRSTWEANFARSLEDDKVKGIIRDWEHEPQTFWFLDIKRGVRSYLPDFKIIYEDGSHSWVEVKGFMDKKSQTKLKRFAKYYPEEKLVVIQKEWFKRHEDLAETLEGWE